MRAIAIVLALAGTASAIPPLPRSVVIHQDNTLRIEAAIAACSKTAAAENVFGAVEVTVRYRDGAVPVATLRATPGLPAKHARCVAAALTGIQLEPNVEAYTTVIAVSFGDEKAILSDVAVAGWQRGKLQLPPYITLTSKGCLRLRGSEPLYDALLRWVDRVSGAELDVLKRSIRPLADDWWIVRDRSDPEGDTHPDICLQRVAPAVSMLWRAQDSLGGDAFNLGTTDVEYTIDPAGKVAGEIGACFTFEDRDRLTPDELLEHRKRLEAALRAFDHGRRKNYERITLHAVHDEPLDVTVKPGGTPLAKGGSMIETRCDHGAALRCMRERGEFTPTAIDDAGIDRCVARLQRSRADLAVKLELTPDGVAKGFEAYGDATEGKLPAAFTRCIDAVFARATWSTSTGGDCYLSFGLDRIP